MSWRMLSRVLNTLILTVSIQVYALTFTQTHYEHLSRMAELASEGNVNLFFKYMHTVYTDPLKEAENYLGVKISPENIKGSALKDVLSGIIFTWAVLALLDAVNEKGNFLIKMNLSKLLLQEVSGWLGEKDFSLFNSYRRMIQKIYVSRSPRRGKQLYKKNQKIFKLNIQVIQKAPLHLIGLTDD